MSSEVDLAIRYVTHIRAKHDGKAPKGASHDVDGNPVRNQDANSSKWRDRPELLDATIEGIQNPLVSSLNSTRGGCNLTTKDGGDNQQAHLAGNITARAEGNINFFI